MALLIAAVGALVPAVARRHPWDQALFNAAVLSLVAAAGAGALALSGWQVESLVLARPDAVLVAVVAGVAMWLLNLLMVATMIALQEAEPLPRIVVGMTWGGDRSALTIQAAEVGLGVVLAGLFGGLGLVLVVGLPTVLICTTLAHWLRTRRLVTLRSTASV